MLLLNVDDDNEDQQIFCEAVAEVDRSVECVTVKDVNEAIRILGTLTTLPDFIFTDMNMPRIDGKEFLKTLKANAIYKSIPVVILSTGIHKEDMKTFVDLGAAQIHAKPTSFLGLVNLIKSVIKTK